MGGREREKLPESPRKKDRIRSGGREVKLVDGETDSFTEL